MKILVLLTDAVYLRNYFDTQIFTYLSKIHQLKFLKRENISTNKVSKFYFDSYTSDTNNKIKTTFFDLLINRHKDKSIYFKFRLKRFYRFDIRYLSELCLENNEKDTTINKLKKIHLLIKNFTIFLCLNLLSTKLCFYFIRIYYDKYIGSNKNLKKKILDSKCDLILFPTNGYSPEVFDVLNISKKYKIKTHFIIDNWDNLSSKMIFFKIPDKIYVWGEQTVEQAKRIHNIPKNKTVKIGSARYKNFFIDRNKVLYSHFNHKYILFLGSSWAWDEEATLNEIDNIIENNKSIFKGLKIIYRYHPFRQRRNKFNKNWKNIIIDPQLNNNSNKKTWPDLNYYPSLIQNANFIIGGLTTMLIEATIFYKKYIAIAYDDGKSLLNQKNALANFEHLKEIDNLSNLYVCKKSKLLETKMIEFQLSKFDLNKAVIDKEREFFLSYDENCSFEKKLSENLIK